VLSQQIRESLIEPRLVSDLHDKPHGRRVLNPFQEKTQAKEEFIGLNLIIS
jgi:hypothetical protein